VTGTAHLQSFQLALVLCTFNYGCPVLAHNSDRQDSYQFPLRRALIWLAGIVEPLLGSCPSQQGLKLIPNGWYFGVETAKARPPSDNKTDSRKQKVFFTSRTPILVLATSSQIVHQP
jgi:hypothetical protein